MKGSYVWITVLFHAALQIQSQGAYLPCSFRFNLRLIRPADNPLTQPTGGAVIFAGSIFQVEVHAFYCDPLP